MDLRNVTKIVRDDGPYDWCVLVSIRPMVRRNAGEGVWDDIEARLRPWARKLLFLEYDENDQGEVVECPKS